MGRARLRGRYRARAAAKLAGIPLYRVVACDGSEADLSFQGLKRPARRSPPMKRLIPILFILALLVVTDREAAAPPQVEHTYAVTPSGMTAWVIDGALNPNLTLQRGKTYAFNVNAIGHSFYIKTQRETGATFAYNDGVKNNGDNLGTVTFDVPVDAPEFLFYQCGVHIAMGGRIFIVSPVGVAGPLPSAVWLGRASPNPASSGTSFRLGLPRDARIDVALFDARGRKVRVLFSGTMTAGAHSIFWDGLDEAGRQAPSGAYFYRMRAEGQALTGRVTVAR